MKTKSSNRWASMTPGERMRVRIARSKAALMYWSKVGRKARQKRVKAACGARWGGTDAQATHSEAMKEYWAAQDPKKRSKRARVAAKARWGK